MVVSARRLAAGYPRTVRRQRRRRSSAAAPELVLLRSTPAESDTVRPRVEVTHSMDGVLVLGLR